MNLSGSTTAKIFTGISEPVSEFLVFILQADSPGNEQYHLPGNRGLLNVESYIHSQMNVFAVTISFLSHFDV